MRCSRCGHEAADTDKFCAECGLFLRDAFVDQRLLHALVPESEGKHREARRELERLVDSAPENALANHLLGSVYFHQGTLDLAIERYERALELAPEFVLCSYDLGVAHYHRGNMPEAIKAFRRCLEIDRHYNAAHYRLAVALFHAGELDLALGDLAAAAREFERGLEEGVGEKSSLYHLEQIRASRGDSS
jgi:tetratricopeptide (TPR) repeat protein